MWDHYLVLNPIQVNLNSILLSYVLCLGYISGDTGIEHLLMLYVALKNVSCQTDTR